MTTPNMDVKRKEFYEGYRKHFEPKLTQGQVNGFERLFDEWEWYTKEYFRPEYIYKEQLAYILATVFHETGKKMLPVREGFAETDEQAIRIVTRMHKLGRISRNYALPDAETGQSYFGRGPIQITWKDNYLKADNELGLGGELVKNPSLALDPVIGAKIAVQGMYQGWFARDPLTGEGVPFSRDLWDYIDPEKGEKDYYNARRIVNGLDKAGLIAGYAERFEKCIELM